jgi:hypothetical protein
LQLQLAQAADYLQLSALQTLMEQDYILKHMAKHPGRVCTTVYNEAATGSTLANAAWHMLECRPYVTLESGFDVILVQWWWRRSYSLDGGKARRYPQESVDWLLGMVSLLSIVQLVPARTLSPLQRNSYYYWQQQQYGV